MAEDQDESSKTEEPTGKRLSDAREEGNVAQSPEVKLWFSMVATLVVVAVMAPPIARTLTGELTGLMEQAGNRPMDAASIGGILIRTLVITGKALALPLIVLTVAGVAGTLVQIGWLVRPAALMPSLSKLSPLAGLKRMLGVRSVIEFAKGLVKVAMVAAVIWFVLKPMVYGIEHYAGLPMAQVMAEAQDLTVRMLIRVTGVLTLIAGADYLYQRFSYFKSLRMTKQEVKEEFKQSEGDPTIKGKQRQIRFQRARRRIAAMVPKADVVVTNPTHFAVAMQYDPKAMQAPKVVAKGADVLAHRIREIAREHDIPIVENPPLARALYAAVEEDQEIPSEHYRAVAEVISYVFKLKGKRLGG